MTGAEKSQSRNQYCSMDPGEEIVISGISGRFPKSRNIEELKKNLMKKADLVTKDGRWKIDHVELPERHGIISDIDKFDSIYFGVSYREAICMDPMARMIMEHTYEAIVDAGVNPEKLRGTNTAVITSCCYGESETTWNYKETEETKFAIPGCSKAMIANRVSLWLGVRGPSYSVDTACSSSLYALDQALRLIRKGECNAAVVATSNLCLHPCVSMQFQRLGVLSQDGRCKSFDDNANGYVRSEAVCAMYLQKVKDAKRVYATVLHTKSNADGSKEQGITFPSAYAQSMLFEEFYKECGIPPTMLSYLEAHGTGTKVGDPEELNAINKVLCKSRSTPLKIGSVKSNIGHTEPASGFCSISKIIIAMETGVIPPNINLKRLRKGVECLDKGRVQVITEPTPWEIGYVGINNFGFGGANAHVLLKPNPKEKINGGAPIDDLARLVFVSGRTETAVASLLSSVESKPLDVEYIRLLHEVHATNISGHQYRGYMIVKPKKSKSTVKEIVADPESNKPVCFLFSGLGSQWPEMGKALMKFDIFSKTIQKCNAAMKPQKIDVVAIITNKDEKMFDNIINSIVGVVALQIGLIDLLKAMNIEPDYIIGHSFGELGCAYADGCLTLKQTILSAYYIGLTCTQSKMIRGAMAQISFGYERINAICPADVDIACHDGPDNCTISGPKESVKTFVATLQVKRTLVREIPCSDIAYHSRYASVMRTQLLTHLEAVISEAKPRSEKWLSTSVPSTQSSLLSAKTCSADYFINCLLGTVLFDETVQLIPKNAVVIEIAPHGVLQTILAKSLHSSVTCVALSQRDCRDNVEYFLQSLGKLYNVGLEFHVANIYPAIEFPVSRSTPMIAPHIRWDHSEEWYVASYVRQRKLDTGESEVEVSLSDEYYDYIVDHVIDGRVLLPATGYILFVWESFSKLSGLLHSTMSVVFEDVKFQRATNMPKHGEVRLNITIQKGTGAFEITEGGTPVASGRIRGTMNPSEEMVPPEFLASNNDKESLTDRDVYKELRLRGYEYGSTFRGIKSASITGSKGHLAWQSNWATFMDTMMQMYLLNCDTRSLFVPTGIQKLIIDTTLHQKIIHDMPKADQVIPIHVYKNYSMIKAGGIEMHGLESTAISRKKPTGLPVLEEYGFVAHCDKENISLEKMVTLSAHLAFENEMIINIKIMEFVDDDDVVSQNELFSLMFTKSFDNLPLIQSTAIIVTKFGRFSEESLPSNVTIINREKMTTDGSTCIITGYNLLSQKKKSSLNLIACALKPRGFILTRESVLDEERVSRLQNLRFNVILEKRFGKETLLLLRKRENLPSSIEVVHVDSKEFGWLEKLQVILRAENVTKEGGDMRLVLVGEGDPESGLLGLANCLRREPGGEFVRTFVIQDETASKFTLKSSFYTKQLELDMAVNVLRPGNVWGSYRHLPLPPPKPRPVYHSHISQMVRADLSSICWVQGSITPNTKKDNLVYITHSALNFKDVMLATGKLALEVAVTKRQDMDAPIGFEFSGVTSTGRRVMGVLLNRGLSNMCIADEIFTWDIPDNFTLEDAATIPCTYSTCLYALYMYGNMKKGDKVLIHAGTGGIGQSAINLALHEGCEVFTTVGTPDKRRFIRETFPSIDDDHIGNSRDISFEQMILKRTNGRGVDIVLNSLAEEKLQASVRCLAPGGRFLEIGKFDLAANNKIKLRPFLKEISFHGVMLDNLIGGSNDLKRQLSKLVTHYLKNNAIKPLTRKCFSKDEVETAFRYMASAKHIGKVLIKIHDDAKDVMTPILAYPRYHCLPNRSYVIFGGLGGLGLEVADWLVLRGAQILILISRGGIKNGYQEYRINTWKSYGVKVSIIAGADASTHEGCEFILKSAEKEAPVDGIFNLAALLKDKLCVNQTVKDFEDSVRPKSWITKRLDEHSKKLCPKLRHFVIFSSVSCGRGTPGQTNYGLGNSVMERICERRAMEGLPALAIEWGAIGEVGLVADMQADNQELVIGGTLQQKVFSCLEELDKFLMQNKPIVASMVVAEKLTGGENASTVYEAVLNIMGLADLTGISTQISLAELGLDSMMAVEIKQTLERDFEMFLTPQDIRNLTFAKIIEFCSNSRNEGTSNEIIQEVVGINLLWRTLGTIALNSEICVELSVKEPESQNEVFFVPGVEGDANIFSTIAAHLKRPATCLQMGVNDADDVQDLVEYFLPHVLKRNKNRKDFAIVGYSFGSLVAIELTRALEARNFTGRLILIDGSPDFVTTMKRNMLPADSDDELEDQTVIALMSILHPASSKDVVLDLYECKTWQEKLNVFFKRIPPEALKLSMPDATAAFTAVYKRLLAIEKYDVSKLPPLRTPITLLKATIASLRNVEPDYGLKKITSGAIKVCEIEGNHQTVLDNQKLAVAINGDLSKLS